MHKKNNYCSLYSANETYPSSSLSILVKVFWIKFDSSVSVYEIDPRSLESSDDDAALSGMSSSIFTWKYTRNIYE